MRASVPSPSTSCKGTIAVFATDASTARMKSQLISLPSVPRYFRQNSLSRSICCASRVEPAPATLVNQPDRRVVIVSAGIDHDVAVIVVRQIDVLRVAAKAKLQDAHAGKTEIVAQGFDVGRDHAKVFGNYRQLAQRVSDGREQFPSRRLNPAAALRGLVAAGNFPAGGKPAKVIDARDVKRAQRRAHPLDPPLESVAPHAVPVVKRISPKLPGGAEVIGRHAGHHDRTAVVVQLELIRIGPNVRRIVGHKNRNVADQLDAASLAVSFERKPLPEEKKLIKLLRLDLLAEFLRGPPRARPLLGAPAPAPIRSRRRRRAHPSRREIKRSRRARKCAAGKTLRRRCRVRGWPFA